MARARALRRQSRQEPGNDSLRYELALAEAEVGTIQERIRSLELFESLRATYGKEARYHRDRARVYEACQQASLAREALEDLLKLDPGDVAARVGVARLRLVELLYHFDLPETARMLEVLEPALALAPNDRGVLFYHSLALEMAAGLPDRESPRLSERGLAEAERMAANDATDFEARLLAAVHAMDLGRSDRAARYFEAALAIAPEDVRSAFLTSRWTAPPAAVRALESRDATDRAAYDTVYWRHHDPSPLTALNENQLEIWKRLALAEFLFARPASGVRGWDTEPGIAFVRYGAPRESHYETGDITATGPGPDRRLPYAGVGRGLNAPLRLQHPSWEWVHHFRGLQFGLRFIDMNLNGEFTADNPTRKTLDFLHDSAPVVFHEAPPGPLRYLAVAAAGFLAEERRVNENVYLGVPLWRPLGDGGWLGDVTMELIVRDTTRTIVRQARHRATPEDVVPMLGSDVSLLLLHQPWALVPGSYTITGYVEDADRKVHGVYTGPLTIRDYSKVTGLVVSDLDLTLRPESRDSRVTVTRLGSSYIPNPLRVATDDRRIDIFYEVYGLT
ncbi:MAG TPA: GWxTD domain-containing protein, partial [Candidatus Eisenbacteria bacterium]